jgi:hypothetical protein
VLATTEVLQFILQEMRQDENRVEEGILIRGKDLLSISTQTGGHDWFGFSTLADDVGVAFCLD